MHNEKMTAFIIQVSNMNVYESMTWIMVSSKTHWFSPVIVDSLYDTSMLIKGCVITGEFVAPGMNSSTHRIRPKQDSDSKF